jgi:hypothetical protein
LRREPARSSIVHAAGENSSEAGETYRALARCRADMSTPHCGLRVDHTGTHYRAVVCVAVAAGERVLHLEGEVRRRPDRHTIQIGVSEHLDAGPAATFEDLMARYPWRFLNHGCRPNVVVRGRELFALRDLAAGEEAVFNYNTTEFDMAEPFTCRCGAEECRGELVRGYRALDEAGRRRIAAVAAPHVVAAARGATAAASG